MGADNMLDRWNLLASHGDKVVAIIQLYMQQIGMDEPLTQTIPRPVIASWVYMITRICECLLGLTPIIQEEGYEAPAEEKFEALEGISDELSRKIFDLLPGELYKHGVSTTKKFNDTAEPGSWLFEIISQSVMPSDSAVAKVLTAICDYLIAEHLELSNNCYRDTHSRYSSPGINAERENLLAVTEVKAFKAMLDEKQAAEITPEEDDEKIRSTLKARYGSVSWFYVSECVENDEEVLKLWNRLGLELKLQTKFKGDAQTTLSDAWAALKPSSNPESLSAYINVASNTISNNADFREHYKMVRSTRRDLFIQYGASGMAVRDDFAVKLTPLSYQDSLFIATKLSLVNNLGNDASTDDDFDNDIADFFKTIRESSGSIDIDIGETCFGNGATLFQVLAALVYQCHTGAIEKVNLTGSLPSDNDNEVFSILLELIPNQLSMEDLEMECDDMTFFGESMSFQDGNKTLIALTCSGNLPKFANMSSLGDEIDESYISADISGLDDEDRLGEMKAIHIAACKSDLESLKVLIEKLKANVNVTMFDGSNALLCALASDAEDEVIQYLIDRGSNINQQIFRGPGWQSNMTRLAGFTPLIMAVNNGNDAAVKMLLKASADTEKHTGPLDNNFPVSSDQLMSVSEYDGNGRCYTALHIATIMSNEEMITELIKVGHANPDSRVLPRDNEYENFGFYEGDPHPFDDEEQQEGIDYVLTTSLHLAEADTFQALIDGGASLLAQNVNLKAAWRRHESLLSDWLLSDALNLENSVVAVCKAKNLPKDVALYITEFYVSLHVAEHFERAYQQEISDRSCWSWLAVGLTHRADAKLAQEESGEAIATSWSLHKHVLCSALSTYPAQDDDEYNEVLDFVRVELKKSKGEEASMLFDKLRSELFNLERYDQNEENEDAEEEADMNCDDEAAISSNDDDGDEDDDVKHCTKKPKLDM